VILVKNTGTQAAEARLSQSDYLSHCDGTNDFGEAGKAPRSNANWITLSPSRLKLAPGETQPVRYQGRAPADAKLRGSFWSLIIVEPNAAPGITPEGKPDTVTVGLQTTVRFAVQIVTEIKVSGCAGRNLDPNAGERRHACAGGAGIVAGPDQRLAGGHGLSAASRAGQ